MRSLSADKIDEGIEALSKAVELLPDEANSRESLGEACLQAGRLEEAEANFTKAVELLPSFGMAWSALGETQGEIRAEVCFGYMLAAEQADADKNHGIHIIPKKTRQVTLNPGDCLITLAENES